MQSIGKTPVNLNAISSSQKCLCPALVLAMALPLKTRRRGTGAASGGEGAQASPDAMLRGAWRWSSGMTTTDWKKELHGGIRGRLAWLAWSETMQPNTSIGEGSELG